MKIDDKNVYRNTFSNGPKPKKPFFNPHAGSEQWRPKKFNLFGLGGGGLFSDIGYSGHRDKTKDELTKLAIYLTWNRHYR